MRAKKNSPHFVIQKHAATHLHYDFRLEVNGVLKSWAIPKGPSLNPADKRLAVMVEDHPYNYRNFEGTIPPDNYGAGTVMIWDTGTYQPLDKNGQPTSLEHFSELVDKGHASFILKGKKLNGQFTLIKMRTNDKGENWLLIKKEDDFSSDEDILAKDRSALSNKTMDQLSHSNKEWTDDPLNRKKKSVKRHSRHHDVMPHDVKPMLAKLAERPFSDKEWLFERKWDGYRAIAEIKPGHSCKLYSRNLLSFNERFPTLVKALEEMDIEAVMDGEIILVDEEGESNFQNLQNYPRVQAGKVQYVLFDLLYCGGYDLREYPLATRKKILRELFPSRRKATLQYSSHTVEDGLKLYQKAIKEGWEGIIAKRIDSEYHSRRSPDWLKIKTHRRQEVIICGYTEPQGSRQKFGSLLLGIYEGRELVYAGHVGTGFNEESLITVYNALQPFITSKPPLKKPPRDNKKVTWVHPKLLCEVSFTEWTNEGQLRHPVFHGLRPDKRPREVHKEVAIGDQNVITNSEKVYFPKEGYTKGELMAYYDAIAPYLLPYLKDRPQTLHRFPDGIERPGFYQKNIGENFPEWVPRYTFEHKGSSHTYLLIPDKKTLLFAANLGCIEFNPFLSRVQSLEYPDHIVIDLDPEDISFAAVVRVALSIHELLDDHKIHHFCKTSGATGLHIYIPLGAKYSYEQAKLFAQLIVSIIHQQMPDITSLERSPARRQKKIYLDYLQNNFGQTIAAPYSVRPRDGAPVSTPLDWSELHPKLNPKQFTIKSTLERVKGHGDIFRPLLRLSTNLASAVKRLKSATL